MPDQTGFRAIGATTYLCPTPAVLVGCAGDGEWTRGEDRPNLVTVAWAGICCTRPPMIGISLRPERYSYELIRRSGEFTVNLVGEPLLAAMDFCGVRSGRDVDKFAALGLTAVQAAKLAVAPALLEAPAYLSCSVRQVLPLGSHDLFLAEIVEVQVGEAYFRTDGSIDEQAMRLVAYVHGKYRALDEELGFFGFSVAGEAALRRRSTRTAQTGTDAAHSIKSAVPRDAKPVPAVDGRSGKAAASGRTAQTAPDNSLQPPPRTRPGRLPKQMKPKDEVGQAAPDGAVAPRSLKTRAGKRRRT